MQQEIKIERWNAYNILMEGEKESKPAEDHICSICLGVFFKPARLAKCKHIYCENCLVEVTLIIENKRCPLCRVPFVESDIQPVMDLWTQLQALYPSAVNERKKLLRRVARFRVGNTTEFLQTNEDNKYRWTVFVEPVAGDNRLSETIQKIQVHLHPTFHPPVVTFEITGNKTVSLTRVGWGTFRIQFRIFWKDLYQERTSEIFHDLQFVPIKEKTVNTLLSPKHT